MEENDKMTSTTKSIKMDMWWWATIEVYGTIEFLCPFFFNVTNTVVEFYFCVCCWTMNTPSTHGVFIQLPGQY